MNVQASTARWLPMRCSMLILPHCAAERRDVESEGTDYSDVALRDAIDAGLVDGPRMQVATRAIAFVMKDGRIVRGPALSI